MDSNCFVYVSDDTPIHVLELGEGNQPLIFLPAEPLTNEFWRPVMTILAEQMRTVAISSRGRGLSGKVPNGHDIATFARDISDVLNTLAIQPFALVGWSAGALVAAHAALHCDLSPEHVVVVDQRLDGTRSARSIDSRLASLHANRRQHHETALKHYWGPKDALSQELLDWMVAQCYLTPTAAHESLMRDATSTNLTALLSWDGKLSVLWSDYGTLQEEDLEQWREIRPGLPSENCGEYGHLFPYANPATVAKALLRLLS